MDRHNQLHSSFRVELPRTLRYAEIISRISFRRRFRPVVGMAIGVASFLGCGLAVIATAGLLALHV